MIILTENIVNNTRIYPYIRTNRSRLIKLQNDIMMESSIQYYRVDRRQIGFLKFILEACEGIVTMSTVDAGLGLVSFRIPPGCEDEVTGILNDLQKDIFMEPYIEA